MSEGRESFQQFMARADDQVLASKRDLPIADENQLRRHELDLSAALGHDVRRESPMDLAERFEYKSSEALKAKPDPDWTDDVKHDFHIRKEGRAQAFGEAARMVRDNTLLSMGEMLEMQDIRVAIKSESGETIGQWVARLTREGLEEMTTHRHSPDSEDDGLEYARLYGVYPDWCEYDSSKPGVALCGRNFQHKPHDASLPPPAPEDWCDGIPK